MELKTAAYLIVPLLQGFEWFDEGLQRSLRERGWPVLTRPESMVMIHIILGIVRPSQIARDLGLSRQAVHTTIVNICDKGLFELQDDPEDKRAKIVSLTTVGKEMRHDAQHIAHLMYSELEQRIGRKRITALIEALSANWGQAPAFGPDDQLLR